MLSRLNWILIKRHVIKHRVLGFFASYQSYADAKCSFSEYNKLHGSTILVNTSLGRFTYVCEACLANVSVGSFCSIAKGVQIGLGIHPTNLLSTNPVFYSKRGQVNFSFAKENAKTEYMQTTIGNDVWIGCNAVIIDGVSIGNGAIIGAGAVVTKDIPPYTIVGGVPAKKIRMRFTDEQIHKIERLNWYEWSIDELKSKAEMFQTEINQLSL